MGSVDPRIDQPNGRAGVVDEIAAGRAGDGVGLLEDLVEMGVGRPLGAAHLVDRNLRQSGGRDAPRGVAPHRHIDGGGVVEGQEDRTQDQGRGHGAAEDGDLLGARGRADEEAGLQVL